MMQPFEIQQSDISTTSLSRRNDGRRSNGLHHESDDVESDDGPLRNVRKRTWSDDEEEGFEDAMGLISKESVALWDRRIGSRTFRNTSRVNGHDYDMYGSHHDDDDNIIVTLFQALRQMLWNADMKWWMCTIIVVFIWFVILPQIYVQEPVEYSVVQYTCADPIKDIDVEEYEEDYIEPSKSLLGKNGTEIWNFMQGGNVDGHKRDYQTARKMKYDWKVKEFGPYLTSGSSIYESACGIGQNLAVTLDILHEVKAITGVVVYGNELIEESASAAQVFFEEYHPFGANLGRICGGIDSTNLSHVPSNSFDLVYCGYITPLPDPLGYEARAASAGTEGNADQRYKTICQNAAKFDIKSASNATAEENPHKRAYEEVQKMQQLQEDWFAAWLSEMIRIARPGVPVLVEEVSLPLCEAPNDWGGVSQDFWTRAVHKYSWKIEKDSIRIDNEFRGNSRYYVAMKKQNDPV
jgi:SAM-dependent methyltransferase